LLLAGVWAVVWIHLFLSFYVGWRPTLPFTALAPPYLPSLIGLYAIIAAGLVRFAFVGPRWARALVACTAAIAILGAAAWRIEGRTYETPSWMKKANEEVAELSRSDRRSPVFAELIHETIQIPMIAYRSLQSGLAVPQRLRFLGTHDTAIAAPSDPVEVRELLKAMESAVRCQSDFVIVSNKLSEYAREGSPLLIYRHGRAIVERLLSELPVIRGPYFDGVADSILVLDNRARATCR
jgi:hypothetical protein